MDINIDNLKYDEKGLIPAVIQDYNNNEILMVGYMNRESLEISIVEKQTCFYSRSRNELWRKGETSGNTQEIISINSDCDNDTLLIKVLPNGPACHTNSQSCFFNSIYGETEETFSIDSLYSMLLDRKNNPKENSYTSYLFKEGEDKILKKIGEESTEVIIGAKNNDNQEVIYEISDLAYHLMVMMADRGISLEEIRRELSKRHIIDIKVKQKTMTK